LTELLAKTIVLDTADLVHRFDFSSKDTYSGIYFNSGYRFMFKTSCDIYSYKYINKA